MTFPLTAPTFYATVGNYKAAPRWPGRAIKCLCVGLGYYYYTSVDYIVDHLILLENLIKLMTDDAVAITNVILMKLLNLMSTSGELKRFCDADKPVQINKYVTQIFHSFLCFFF